MPASTLSLLSVTFTSLQEIICQSPALSRCMQADKLYWHDKKDDFNIIPLKVALPGQAQGNQERQGHTCAGAKQLHAL